jgi:glycosyltransferase involved in cell wall biosynthesis
MFTDAYWPRVNGVTVSVETFASALITRGHDILIVCPFYPENSNVSRFSLEKSEVHRGIPESCVIRVPSIPIFISKEDRLSSSHKLFWVYKKISKFKPDIIHIQSEFVTADFGFFCARVLKTPAIYTFHTLWEEYVRNYLPHVPFFILRIMLKLIVGRAFKLAFRVIVPSITVRDAALSFKPKHSPFVLPTGFDPKLFEYTQYEVDDFKSSFETRYPQIKNKKILLYAGRIGKEKNIDFLLDIAPTIFKTHKDTIFLVVGNGPDLFEYKERCDDLNLQDDIIFTGYMDRKVLCLTYLISKIFVFPSLTETQGLVTIEAMFCGLPVVAIGVQGTADVMKGDNGGFMVKNDKLEFTDRVRCLLDNENLYRQKSAEAKEYAKQWSIDILSEKLETIYTESIKDYG